MTTDGIYYEDVPFAEAAQQDDSLVTIQIAGTAPIPPGTEAVTGAVLPDRSIKDRLSHLPEDLYDLRDTSHLMRFMKALMGESGVGQLRRRYLVTIFQQVMNGTHFYDLDRFYGAIFGISRNLNEILGIDPSEGALATQNEWDQIQNADASFRDRIHHLASAINMGATYPGIQNAAEALTQVECDIYEAWDLLDAYGPAGPAITWEDYEELDPSADLPTWTDIEDIDPEPLRPSWQEMSASVTIGRTGTNSRAEVIVVPRKDYDRVGLEHGQEEADRQRREDEHSIIRVLSVLKPASTLLTVDSDGIAIHRDAQISWMEADSNFWNVATRVIPRADLVAPEGIVYPLSLQQALSGILAGDRREIPKPPWAIQQAAEWSYAPEVTAVRSYAFRTGADDDMDTGGDGPITDSKSDHVVTYSNGKRERFTADRAVLDPRRALAARYASEGILISSPYSTPRATASDGE